MRERGVMGREGRRIEWREEGESYTSEVSMQ